MNLDPNELLILPVESEVATEGNSNDIPFVGSENPSLTRRINNSRWDGTVNGVINNLLEEWEFRWFMYRCASISSVVTTAPFTRIIM